MVSKNKTGVQLVPPTQRHKGTQLNCSFPLESFFRKLEVRYMVLRVKTGIAYLFPWKQWAAERSHSLEMTEAPQ